MLAGILVGTLSTGFRTTQPKPQLPPTAIVPPSRPVPTPIEGLLPSSSDRELTSSDLEGLSKTQLTLARNEIFARHGRPFKDAFLQAHFSSFSWYKPDATYVIPEDDNRRLNSVEQRNVDLIRQTEQQRSGT
jgi:hypothetical protein